MSLARRSSEPRALDAYERRFMDATSAAFRQRTSVPGRVFLGMVAAAAVVSVSFGGLSIAMAPAAILAWLCFAVLRVAVGNDRLSVHFGWMRRSIPLGNVDAVATTRFSPHTGGSGVSWLRQTARGTEFRVRGSGGGAVEIRFHDEHGPHTWLLASSHPERLRDAILERRAECLAARRAPSSLACERALAIAGRDEPKP